MCVYVCVLVSVALFRELFLRGSIVSCGEQRKSHELFGTTDSMFPLWKEREKKKSKTARWDIWDDQRCVFSQSLRAKLTVSKPKQKNLENIYDRGRESRIIDITFCILLLIWFCPFAVFHLNTGQSNILLYCNLKIWKF